MAPLIVHGAARGTGAFGGRARAGRDARWARAMRDKEEKPHFTKTPQNTVIIAVVKTELPAWREMQPSQSFEQKFREPRPYPPCRLK
jgi:ribosomal protein L15